MASYSYHRSNQNEYLAQCFLSALGASAPVIRQEDIGIDFHCTLSDENNKRLTFHSPFIVQCGSKEGKDFIYGYDRKVNRWRSHVVEWFYDQQVPFFVCEVDVPNLALRLYNTSAKWMVRNECGHLNMAAVELLAEKTFDPVRASIPTERFAERTAEHDGIIYGIPLGRPIVELMVSDLNKPDLLQSARVALRQAIEVEAENITHNRDLKIYACRWFNKIEPNDASRLNTAWGIAANPHTGEHIIPILQHLQTTLSVLALNLTPEKQPELIDDLRRFFRHFDPASFSEELVVKFPQSIRDDLLKKR